MRVLSTITTAMIRTTTIVCILLVPTFTGQALAASSEDNYVEYCLKCHGEGGVGDGPAAAVLDVEPGDFSDCERMKSLSPDYLTKIVTDGGEAVDKSSQMPRIGNKLGKEEIQELIQYIGTFCEE